MEAELKEVVEKYIETLDKEGSDKAREYAESFFGKEGDENFKKDEYIEFVANVAATIIDRNIKLAADEAAAVEEEVKDEADA